ncbi:MAG: hypothetical protein AAF959_28085 [Cyanobacteria bacterium P01_D01_bin.56]
MLTSEELVEFKYEEILEYQDIITNAAIDSITTYPIATEPLCLMATVVTSLLMSCFTKVFTPGLSRKKPRQP